MLSILGFIQSKNYLFARTTLIEQCVGSMVFDKSLCNEK